MKACLWTVLVLLAATAPSPLSAQRHAAGDTVRTVPPLAPGDRIRVRMVAERGGAPGHFVAIDSAALRWTGDVDAEVVLTVPLDRLAALDRMTAPPDRTRGFWIGAGIGAAASLAGGVLLQMAPSDGANFAIAGGVVLAPVLGLLGGVVGAAAAPARWEPVEIVPAPGIDAGGASAPAATGARLHR